MEQQQVPQRWSGALRFAKWAGVVAAALVVIGIVGALLSPSAPDGQPAPASPPATAADVLDRMQQLHPAPDPRDTTPTCAAEGCRRMITTDRVSVFEWPTNDLAAQWAESFGNDAHQAGRFVLGYSGSEQELTPEEYRSDWAALLDRDFATR